MFAWKRADDHYYLLPDLSREPIDGDRIATVLEVELARFPIQKVIGVITGPSSCGCEPAMFRWVGAREVEAGRVTVRRDILKLCAGCKAMMDSPGPPYVPAFHQCDIIDVCGEADVAEAVYEAEFKAKVGSLS